MDKVYETPVAVELGDFSEHTGEGIGGQVEGESPIADRPV